MENTGQPVNVVLADAGYRSEENLDALESAEIDGYVALSRESKEVREPAAQHQATGRMQGKLRTTRGRQRYRRRKHIAEPPFGWLKHVLGFRSFSLRGLSNVAGEFNLVALALNLRRMKGLQRA